MVFGTGRVSREQPVEKTASAAVARRMMTFFMAISL